MKYKKAIIFSTIMIFVVAAAVALGWLFRARYFIVNDLNGLTGETAESGLYSFVSETLEKKVVYRALYGDGGIWVRPLSMWSEEVTLPDGSKTKRFTLTEETEK